MDTNEKINKIVSVFTNFFQVYEKRLEYAYASRDKMIEELKNNKIPTGYRFKFLSTTSNKIINVLQDLAEEFNLLHPQDRCTIHDLLDIIETVKYKLAKYASEDEDA